MGMDEKPFVLVQPARSDLTQSDVLPNDIAELEKCLSAVDAEEAEWQEYIKQLSASENPAKGIFFAAELHEGRLHKMQLSYVRACCKAKINRLRIGEQGLF